MPGWATTPTNSHKGRELTKLDEAAAPPSISWGWGKARWCQAAATTGEC